MQVYVAVEYDEGNKIIHGVFSTYAKAHEFIDEKGIYDFDIIPCEIDKPIED